MASNGGDVVDAGVEVDEGRPVGWLRILNQAEYDECDYPVFEGESSIGRDDNCDLSIDSEALSRIHAILLVEQGVHFIKDNKSINKTFRNSLQLRPDAYYELTNGIEVTLANVRCQYFTERPASKEDMDELNAVLDGMDCEATQAYGLGDGGEDDSTTASEDDEAKTALTINESHSMVGSDDTGATTSYATAPEKQEEGETISRSEDSNLGGAPDEDEDSCDRRLTFSVIPIPSVFNDEADCEEGPGISNDEEEGLGISKVNKLEKKKVVTLIEPEVSSGTEAVDPKSGNDENQGKGLNGVDPTVAYEMETNEELESEDPVGGGIDPTIPYAVESDDEDHSEKSGGMEPTVPYNVEKENEDSVHVDPTVAYAMETDDEDHTDGSAGVEPTVPYKSEKESKEPVNEHIADPTVAYAMETDDEDHTDGSAGVEPTVPYKSEKESKEPVNEHIADPTVAYAIEADEEDQSEGSAGVEPTVPYKLDRESEEPVSEQIDPTVASTIIADEDQVEGSAGVEPSVAHEAEGGTSEESRNIAKTDSRVTQVTEEAGPSVASGSEVVANTTETGSEVAPITKSSDSVVDSDQTDIEEEELKSKPSTSAVAQEKLGESNTVTVVHTELVEDSDETDLDEETMVKSPLIDLKVNNRGKVKTRGSRKAAQSKQEVQKNINGTEGSRRGRRRKELPEVVGRIETPTKSGVQSAEELGSSSMPSSQQTRRKGKYLSSEESFVNTSNKDEDKSAGGDESVESVRSTDSEEHMSAIKLVCAGARKNSTLGRKRRGRPLPSDDAMEIDMVERTESVDLGSEEMGNSSILAGRPKRRKEKYVEPEKRVAGKSRKANGSVQSSSSNMEQGCSGKAPTPRMTAIIAKGQKQNSKARPTETNAEHISTVELTKSTQPSGEELGSSSLIAGRQTRRRGRKLPMTTTSSTRGRKFKNSATNVSSGSSTELVSDTVESDQSIATLVSLESSGIKTAACVSQSSDLCGSSGIARDMVSVADVKAGPPSGPRIISTKHSVSNATDLGSSSKLVGKKRAQIKVTTKVSPSGSSTKDEELGESSFNNRGSQLQENAVPSEASVTTEESTQLDSSDANFTTTRKTRRMSKASSSTTSCPSKVSSTSTNDTASLSSASVQAGPSVGGKTERSIPKRTRSKTKVEVAASDAGPSVPDNIPASSSIDTVKMDSSNKGYPLKRPASTEGCEKPSSKRTKLRTAGSEQPSVPLNNLPSTSSPAMLSPSTPTHKSNTAKTFVDSKCGSSVSHLDSKQDKGVDTEGNVNGECLATGIEKSPANSNLLAVPSKGAKPSVMFTGVIDKEGEKKIKLLGGFLADSVYGCTHLITDKIRRTVKFLCCLSRGCVIVNDTWLTAGAKAGHFLPPEDYTVKDKVMEKQHNFTLVKSIESARFRPLLTGYTVYMTPSIRPTREQMSDIIICSGGEPAHFVYPLPRAPKILVLSCEEDLDLCKECMKAGQPVHLVELVLGGVLRQKLDLSSHLLAPPTSAKSPKRRPRRAAESANCSSPAVTTKAPKPTPSAKSPKPTPSAKPPKPTPSAKPPKTATPPVTRRGRSKADKQVVEKRGRAATKEDIQAPLSKRRKKT